MRWIIAGPMVRLLATLVLVPVIGFAAAALVFYGIAHLDHRQLHVYVEREGQQRNINSETGPLIGRLQETP
jgi:phosphate/sulfate permease